MKRIFLSILAVGTALALAAPVWAGGEVLSNSELAGIEAAGVEIENSCALCYQVNKELDVDVEVDIEKSFNKTYLSKKAYISRKSKNVRVSKNGSWRDMYFDNGILIGDDVENNNAVNFIMANGGGSSKKGRNGKKESWDNGKNGKKGKGGSQSIAAQNNFLLLKADGTGLGAHATAVNQINNAFGGVYVDQSDSTYINIKKVDIDIDDSYNKTFTKNVNKSKSFSYSKHVDIDVDVYKKSVYVRK